MIDCVYYVLVILYIVFCKLLKNVECYNVFIKWRKCNIEDVLCNKKNYNKIDIYICWRMCLLGKYFFLICIGNLILKYMYEKKMLYIINK